MRVVLDESECAIDSGSAAEALASVAAEANRRGRVIVDVYVDGHRCSANDLDQIEARAGAAAELRLVSAEPRSIVAEALSTAQQALAEATQVQRDAAELLQAGKTFDAFSTLASAVALWAGVRQAVADGCSLIDLNLDTICVGDRPATTTISLLMDHLRELRTALESLDVVRLADILLYEMPDVIGQWQDLLAELHDRVHNGR